MRKKINHSHWPPYDKLVVWTSIVVGFFGSFRMGELLSPHTLHFDQHSTLLWSDISFSGKNCLLRIRHPKNRSLTAETISLVPFPHHRFSPPHLLHKLLLQQQQLGILSSSQPVFKFASNNLLTKRALNSVLHACFPHHHPPLTARSVRTAIPTILSTAAFPVPDSSVQAWGRWQSDAFHRYQRPPHIRRQRIYDHLLTLLLP